MRVLVACEPPGPVPWVLSTSLLGRWIDRYLMVAVEYGAPIGPFIVWLRSKLP